MRRLTLLAALVTVAGCGSDDSNGGSSSGLTGTSRYAVHSIVTSPDGQDGYVTILDSLVQRPTVGLSSAREFSGPSDIWVYEGSVYVSGGETPTVTKFTLTDDGKLVDPKVLNFSARGLTDAAFWNNTFISATKAYMLNGLAQYIVWNPTTMEITNTVDLPKIENRNGLIPRAGSADRSTIVHDGRLYQTVAWYDEQWAHRTDDSLVLVFDVNADKFVQNIAAPCPGLDVGTKDDSGHIYFSPWTGGAGTALVLHTAPTCVVDVDTATATATVAFKFADVAGGREGSDFHYVGNGKFVFTAFHHEKVDLANAKEPFGIIGGLNWHVWNYDPQTKTATEMQSVDWNSGAAYWFKIDGVDLALMPATGYTSSTVYNLGIPSTDKATRLFDVTGYNMRLFKVR
ncbi:hypothetical protein LVJ94_47540 [Pendulispora rubella]|uniref:Uncharacterized protein n=1 Tax=Pendulispora rubella TaxID=2741070 RepID=A0ABZ2L5N6_9BACT